MVSKDNKPVEKDLLNLIVEKSPLFRDSKKEDVTELFKSSDIVTYKKGDHVFEAGKDSNFMMIIIQGKVAVFLNKEHIGDRVRFDLLGNPLIIEDRPQSETTIVISKELKAIRVDIDKFRKFLKTDSKVMVNLLLIVSEELRESSFIMAELMRNRRKLESEIKRRKEAEEKLRTIAHYDVLTKLPNRFLLNDRFENAINNSERHPVSITMMFIDLDDFKEINDTMGHQAGDQLLVLAAQRIRKCLRKSDTVARIGGDEFIILMVNYEENHSPEVVAERIINTLSKKYIINGLEAHVTSSIGIAECSNKATSVEELINNADTAMYKAKKLGKNNYQFY